LQFALTAMFHFIFVQLTMGLVIIIAVIETIYVRTGNELYQRMAKFWGKLFVINFVLGVVTGLTLEFQFGMNWSEFSKLAGDIFGAPLAIEATVAFFLESIFLGVWIFGWERLSKLAHLWAIWMVALGSNLSALWILLANGWLQHPVGYVLRGSRAELTSFFSLVFNTFSWLQFLHAVTAGYIAAAFFVMGISAYHLLCKNELEFFKKSFRIALAIALFTSIFQLIEGHFHAVNVERTQPAKLAAMESVWETRKGAPLYLIQIPDEKNERNLIRALPIPGFVSFLSYMNFGAEVQGLKEFPREDRPPVTLTFFSFRIMVVLGLYFILAALIGWYLQKRDKLLSSRRYLRLILYSIPLPYIASELGWVVTEAGRQPWLVYGVMRTSSGVSPLARSQVLLSFVGFAVFYGLLALVDLYLLFKFSRQGPALVEEAGY